VGTRPHRTTHTAASRCSIVSTLHFMDTHRRFECSFVPGRPHSHPTVSSVQPDVEPAMERTTRERGIATTTRTAYESAVNGHTLHHFSVHGWYRPPYARFRPISILSLFHFLFFNFLQRGIRVWYANTCDKGCRVTKLFPPPDTDHPHSTRNTRNDGCLCGDSRNSRSPGFIYGP